MGGKKDKEKREQESLGTYVDGVALHYALEFV